MYCDLWLRRACWLGSVAVVLAAGTLVQAQDVLIRRAAEPGEAPQVIRFIEAPEDAERDILFPRADGEAADGQPSHWLGLICEPLDAPQRAQLKLKDQGLWVREVAPDAPAAKAGVKGHDILLAVGDQAMSDVRDLVDAVEKSEGKEITLHLLRDGEKKSIQVTPAKREKTARTDELPGDVRRWLEKHRAGADGWRIETLRPGVLGWKSQRPHKLPKDMTVTITKEGESPTKIVVKQGDKTWETTEDKLKELPEEVRKHVLPMLRPGAAWFEKAVPAPPVLLPGEFDLRLDRRMERAPPGTDRKLEKQVDELRKQIDKLQKAVEEISKAKGEKPQ